jgi:stage II sporulation protein D
MHTRKRKSAALGMTALLLAFLAFPMSAEAGVTWAVKGHGFGHGVGMSQYGAYGFAKKGKGYRFILGHYYRGTSVGKLGSPRVVRVLLDVQRGDIAFSGARSACGRSLDPGRAYQAHRNGNSVKLRTSGGRVLSGCGRKLRAAGNGRLKIGGVAYRGALETVPTDSDSSSLNAVNAVAVDQYVGPHVRERSSPPRGPFRGQAASPESRTHRRGWPRQHRKWCCDRKS